MINLARFSFALTTLWPQGDKLVPGLRAGIVKSAPDVLAKYGVDDALTLCMMFGQFSEECGAGLELQENMNYSAVRLLQVFPSHFSHQQAIAAQHNPKLIADMAYGGRMGNLPRPSDDGWNFRGQGLSQVTGHDGYAALSKKTGLDLIKHPELIIAPDTALECAVGDFDLCGCMPYARRGDIVGVSSCLNVGHYTTNVHAINGFQDRVHWTSLWKHQMGLS